MTAAADNRMPGGELERLREQLGLSRADLAGLLNETPGIRGQSYASERVAHWENGHRQVPKHVAAFVETLALEQGIERLQGTREDLSMLAGLTSPGDGPGDAPPPQPPLEGGGNPAAQVPLSHGGAYAAVCTDL